MRPRLKAQAAEPPGGDNAIVAIRIRTAALEDVAGITEVHEAGWRIGYASLFEPALLERGIEMHCSRWPGVLGDPDFDPAGLIVAELDRRVVGFAHFGPVEGADEMYLHSFYVHPAHWGTGVATELLKEIVASARRRRARGIRLTTYAGVSRARSFYEKSGFEPTGRGSGYMVVAEDPVPVPEMEYRLEL